MSSTSAPTVDPDARIPASQQWSLFRRFFKLLRPYRAKFWLSLALVLVAAPLAQLAVFLTRDLTDSVILGSDRSTPERFRLLTLFLGSQVLLWLAGYLLNSLKDTMTWYLKTKLTFDLQMKVYRHLMGMPLSLFRQRPIGEHMFRASGDIHWGGGAVWMVTELPIIVFTNVYGMIWTVGLLSLVDPLLALAVAVFLVPYGLLERLKADRIRPIAFRQRTAVEDESASVRENIAGLRTLKSIGWTAFGRRRLAEKAVKVRRADQVLWWRHFIWNTLVIWPMEFLFEKGVWIYVAWRVINGELTIGDWVVVFALVAGMKAPLQWLLLTAANFRTTLVSAQRLTETLDAPQEREDDPPPIPGGFHGQIEFQNVSFSYGAEDLILDRVSFVIRPGEKIALVGPSGAGKSTVLSLLLGIITPTSGKILVDGHDLNAVSRSQWLSSTGVVLQETSLFDGTLLDNVRYGLPSASDEQVMKAIEDAGLGDYVESLPFGELTKIQNGGNLSGGQKQRIGIARALLRDPVVLLADEATANLDAECEQEVWESLNRAGAGRTMISVLHRLDAASSCDRIVVLEGGRLIEEGAHSELLERGGVYASLFSASPPESDLSNSEDDLRDYEVAAAGQAQPISLNPQRAPDGRLTEEEGLAWKPGRWKDLETLGKVAGLAKPHAWRIALVSFAGIAGLTLGAIPVLLSGPLLDKAFPQRDFGLALTIFAALLILDTMRKGLDVITGLQSEYLLWRLKLDTRLKFYRHLQSLSVRFSDARGVGENVFRATFDVDSVAAMLAQVIPATVNSAYSIALMTALVTFLDSTVALIVAAFLIPYAIVLWKVTTIRRDLDRALRLQGERATGRLQEGLHAMVSVRALGNRRYEQRRFAHLTSSAIRTGVRSFWWLFVQELSLNHVISQAMDKTLWAVLASKVIRGDLTMGGFQPLLVFAGQLAQPFKDLLTFINWIRQNVVPAERVLQTLDVAPKVVNPQSGVVLDTIEGRITFEGCAFGYEDGTPALAKFDAEIPTGRRVAIVGPSGAGKSTLLSLVLRLNEPSEGSVKVDGHDLKALDLEAYQRRVAVVQQGTFLFSGTVADNLRLTSPSASSSDMLQALDDVGLSEWVQRLPDGLNTDLQEGTALSVGQRQRLGISRALLGRPSLWVLDEPTSALDPATEGLVMETLWKSSQGCTVILVTHRLNTALQADEVWVLSGGQRVQAGPPSRLAEEPGLFKNLLELYKGSKPKEEAAAT